jgi:hypothetical protein
MGTNLAVNPAAVLTDLRHPDAQGLTDGAGTLALSREKTHVATRRTRGLPTLRQPGKF